MNKIILGETHYFHSITKEVTSICEPLKQYKINYFVYARCFDDGKIYTLITDPALHLHHFNNQYPLTPVIPQELVKEEFHYIALPNQSSQRYNQAIYDFKVLFGINLPIFFFERGNDYIDLYIYSCMGDDLAEIINLYMNKLNILEKFKTDFKTTAHKLTLEASQHKIIAPENMRQNLINAFNCNPHKSTQQEIYTFTQKQEKCLSLLVRGKTFKQIAKTLSISPRTVECHLDAIKKKLNCKNRSQVIEKIVDHGFANNQ